MFKTNITAANQISKSDSLRKMDAYWRSVNYVSVGQIFLYDNPLLKEPSIASPVKPKLLGQWGTTPDLYIKKNGIDMPEILNWKWKA